MTLPISLNDLLVSSVNTNIDKNFFNSRFTALYSGLLNIDSRMTVFDAAETNLVNLGLQRINSTLGPFLSTLQEAAQLGFLVATATLPTPLGLSLGQPFGVVLTSDGASLFTPTPYLLAQDNNNSNNWGILQLDAGGWNNVNMNLATHVIYSNSGSITSNSWTISASGGIVPAMVSMLAQTQAAQTAVSADLASIVADVALLESLVAAVQSGPVASVCGYTGIVSLAVADIGGLTAALAAKASVAALTAATAGFQPASSNLTTLSNLSVTGNSFLFGTAPGQFGLFTPSSFVMSFLQSSSVSAMQTAVGVSSLGRSVFTAPDTPTALTALGVSSFGQQLVAAANPGAAATLLDITLNDVALQPTLKSVTSAAYTLLSSDYGKTIVWTAQRSAVLTFPNNMSVGWRCRICVGDLTTTVGFSAASGATIISKYLYVGNVAGAAILNIAEVLVTSNSGGVSAVYVLSS